MIGYAYVNKEWYMCKFDDNDLFITKTKCNKPRIVDNDLEIPSNIIFVMCEDGLFYYFDKSSSVEIKPLSEYYQFVYKSINYFVLKGVYQNFSLGMINKISLVDGTISVMFQLLKPMNIMEFEYKSKKVKIIFNKRQENSMDFCALEYGNVLLEDNKICTKNSIDVEFEATNDIPFVLSVICKVYDFIRFVNCSYRPYIRTIEVYTSSFILEYADKNINYNSLSVGNYSYIGNINDKNIGNIFDYVLKHDECKFDFLSLLNKHELKFEDTNILAEVIDAISPQYDPKLNDPIAKEIVLYEKLKDKIKDTINEFEIENEKLDAGKKDFIQSLVEMSKFRQKVEYLLSCYNEFAKEYSSNYIILSENEIIAISKDIQTERNKIHGESCDKKKKAKKVEPACYLAEAQYVLFGLILYISKECQLSSSEIFNLFNSVFINRIKPL